MPRKPAFISHSREREAEIQARMMAVLEARFRRRLAQEVERESNSLISGYRDLGFMPSVSDRHSQELRDIYRDLAYRSALVFGRRIVSGAAQKGHVYTIGNGKARFLSSRTVVEFDLECKVGGFWGNLFQSLASAWVNLEAIRRRIQSVTETTRNRLIQEVQRGQREGLGVDAIARMMRDNLPAMSLLRGALIARTETHGAANFAAYNTALQTGLDLRKEWVSVIDMRTRSFGENDEFDHLSMDGQTVAMDDPFLMPWRKGPAIPAMYPGAAELPPGAVINCRCAVVYTVAGLDD